MDDGRHVLGVEKVHMGGAASVEVAHHELFKRCLVHSASRMIVSHNHPTGECLPSLDDLQLTWRIANIGKRLGIELEDHLVFSFDGVASIRDYFEREKYSLEDDYDGSQLESIADRILQDPIPPYSLKKTKKIQQSELLLALSEPGIHVPKILIEPRDEALVFEKSWVNHKTCGIRIA